MELSSAKLGFSGNYGQISMCNEVYGYTHLERVNGTIRNLYLNRWGIGSRRELALRLRQAAKAYNESRLYQRLGKIAPLMYEKQLESIPKPNRKKMKMYTARQQPLNASAEQLDLFHQQPA